MANKEIRLSEARILIYLSQADLSLNYANRISQKLQMDYGYVLRQLGGMVFKNWLKPLQRETRKHYLVTKTAPLDEAKQVISKSLKK